MTTFSDRLKEAMYAQNLKQIDLVHIAAENNVKLGKSHVSQYVSGKTVPRNDILHFLADTLHVDADWLLGDSQENFTARENNSVAPKAPSTTKTSGSVGTSNSSKRGTTPMKKAITDKNDNNNAGSSAMHIFKKSSKLDNVLYDVRGPVVEEAARMEERGTHVLKLNIGNPAPFGFRTPDEVIYDMSQQLSDCEGYSPSQGLFSARKAIMQYSQIKKLPNVTINDIYTGNGVSELINLCMSALLDNGDEILIPSPDYPLWTACATLAGGKAVHYICDEQSDWYPDIEDMRKAAEFRGGKCLSPVMTKGDLSTPLDWECQFGHRFKASPTLVLLGGHWCPECLPLPWNYDEIAKGNPFFAQVWYPFHDKKEHNVYDESIFTDFKE